jgi:hypothetical protein
MTRLLLAIALAVTATGCASSRFDRHLRAQEWESAAAAFAGDSALLRDRDALLRAAALHAVPERPTYDPDRAAVLLETFIAQFGDDPRRDDATARLALLNEIRALRRELQALKEIDFRTRPE